MNIKPTIRCISLDIQIHYFKSTFLTKYSSLVVPIFNAFSFIAAFVSFPLNVFLWTLYIWSIKYHTHGGKGELSIFFVWGRLATHEKYLMQEWSSCRLPLRQRPLRIQIAWVSWWALAALFLWCISPGWPPEHSNFRRLKRKPNNAHGGNCDMCTCIHCRS